MPEPFTFPTSSTHTGKVQYRIDRAHSVKVSNRTARRGEVLSAKNPNFTNPLVASGQFAHVDADAPVGIPDEFMTDAERAAKAKE